MSIIKQIRTGNLAEAKEMIHNRISERCFFALNEQKKVVAAQRYGLDEGIFDRFKKKKKGIITSDPYLSSASHKAARNTDLEVKNAKRSARIHAGTYVMEKDLSKEEKAAAREARMLARNKLPMEIGPKSEYDAMAADHKARQLKPRTPFTGLKLNNLFRKY